MILDNRATYIMLDYPQLHKILLVPGTVGQYSRQREDVIHHLYTNNLMVVGFATTEEENIVLYYKKLEGAVDPARKIHHVENSDEFL